MAKQILIYGTIGYDFWTGRGLTAASFKKEFDEAVASGEDIEILINSPGGSVFEGISIYNTIVKNNANVTTIVDGIAYSMGAVIAMAGKKRKAYKNTSIMMHNCSGGAYGNANDLRGALEMMEVLDKNLVTSIAQITGLSEKDVTDKWFDYRDHTLTATDALAEGLLTELIDVDSEGVPSNLNAMSKTELFAFYNKQDGDKQEGFLSSISKIISDAIGLKPTQNPVIKPTPENLNLTNTDMKMKILSSQAALAALLAVSFASGETEKEVELTDAHLATINSKLGEYATAMSTATASINEKNATIANQAAKITALEKETIPPAGDAAGATTEGPDGAKTEDPFYSETDAALAQLKASMGPAIPTGTK